MQDELAAAQLTIQEIYLCQASLGFYRDEKCFLVLWFLILMLMMKSVLLFLCFMFWLGWLGILSSWGWVGLMLQLEMPGIG